MGLKKSLSSKRSSFLSLPCTTHDVQHDVSLAGGGGSSSPLMKFFLLAFSTLLFLAWQFFYSAGSSSLNSGDSSQPPPVSTLASPLPPSASSSHSMPGPPAQQVDSPRRHWPIPRESPYSSFECTAGSQVFPFPLQETQRPHFSAANDAFMRMCLLRDVCFVGGRLTYFEDPGLASAAPASMGLASLAKEGLVKLGYLQSKFGLLGGSFSPDIVPGPRPPHLKYLPHDQGGGGRQQQQQQRPPLVHALGQLSFAQSWGHVLVDTLLPSIGVAEVYGYHFSDVQFLNTHTCDDFYYTQEHPTSSERCAELVSQWVTPLLTYPWLSPSNYSNTCFPALLLGYESSLSLAGMYAHRAQSVRTLREVTHTAHGLPLPTLPLLTHHRVLVLEKGGGSPIGFPTMCTSVREWASQLTPPPPVDCLTPQSLSPLQQLKAVSTATLVVAENGSTGYMALFQRPGTGFLSILSRHDTSGGKEPQVLLYLTDVQVLYSSEVALVDGKEGPGTLLLALSRAGTRLNLEPVALSTQ